MRPWFGWWLALLLSVDALAAEVQRVNDALAGSTTGTQEGGAFVSGGWQAAAGDSRISYDLGAVYSSGRFEVDLTNFLPCSQPNNEKCHPMSMWQSTNQSRDSSGNAGESHWIFRTGNNYWDPCEYKLLTKAVGALPPASPDCVDNEARIDTGYSWDANATYHYTLIWNGGHIELRKRVNGNEVTLYSFDHCAPMRLRYLLIGRDRETKPNYGEQPGVIYSNVQVWVDDGATAQPDAGVLVRDATVADAGNGAVSTWLDPVDDTFGYFLEPALAHGDQATVQVGGDGNGAPGRIIYFKFDLRGVSGAVVSARLHVVATNAGGGGTIAAVSNNGWTEETLTWNNRPAVDGSPLATLSSVVIDDRYVWDVSAGIAGGDFRSFAISSTNGDGAAYASKENVEVASRPRLELVYRPGVLPDAGARPDQAIGVDTAAPLPDAAAGDRRLADAAGHDSARNDAASADAPPGDRGGSDTRAAASCQSDRDCLNGYLCRSDQCVPSATADTGCGCASRPATTGSVVGALIALVALVGRRRR